MWKLFVYEECNVPMKQVEKTEKYSKKTKFLEKYSIFSFDILFLFDSNFIPLFGLCCTRRDINTYTHIKGRRQK